MKHAKSTLTNSVQFLRFVIIAVLAYSVTDAFIDFENYRKGLLNQPFAQKLAEQLVYVTPAFQCIALICLSTRKFLLIGLGLSSSIFFIMTVYHLWILSGLAPFVPCTCTGISEALSWETQLLIYVGLLIMSVLSLVAKLRPVQE